MLWCSLMEQEGKKEEGNGEREAVRGRREKNEDETKMKMERIR